MKITESRLRRIIRNVIAESMEIDDIDLAIERLSGIVEIEAANGTKPSDKAIEAAREVFRLIEDPNSGYNEEDLFRTLCDDPANQPHREAYLANLGIYDLEETVDVDEDYKRDFETFQPRRY